MLPDTQDFIDTIRSTVDFFSGKGEVIITRAPGRLDVMGGIADYSGSLVLQLPIADATHVALQKNDGTRVRILSNTASESRYVEFDLSELRNDRGEPIEFSVAQQKYSTPDKHWIAYTAGVLLTLMHEGIHFPHGVDILISSNVPEGKGVSSSAAIEVAVMQAVNVAFNLDIHPERLAILCQKTENLVAGAPCGIMDQLTSSCGEQDRLLELLCQPAELLGTLNIPAELEVWGIDSGVRHSVGGSDYGTVRTAAFMGYRILAGVADLTVSAGDFEGKVSINDPLWNGYLANITTEEFEAKYSSKIPTKMTGSEFLNHYRGTTDPVTTVRPGVEYPVLMATRHPIYENARVREFASILKSWNSPIERARGDACGPTNGSRLGELMFQSHESYSDCGLGSEATNHIVRLVRELSNGELFGARITGGGSGGTVAVLGRRGARGRIEEVRKQFSASTGYLPLIISGSSPGAGAFGHLTVDRLGSSSNPIKERS